MLRTALAAIALCSASCVTDTTKDTGTTEIPTDGGTETGTETCSALVTSVTPANGAVVPVNTVVSATFDLPISPDDPHSMSVFGVQGTVTLADDGLSMTWTAGSGSTPASLAADTVYTVTASVCTSELQTTFRTAPDPVDLSALAGQTYVLPWSTVDIVDPPKGDLLELEIDYLLAQIVTVDPATATATAVGTMGYASAVGTDTLASPTPECSTLGTDQIADFSENPLFRIAGDFDFVIAPDTGKVATLEDFELRGTMVDGGATIRDPYMSGKLATESISLLGNRGCYDPLVQFFGVTCVPCVTSPAGYCMLIEATAPTASVDPAVDVVGTCTP